MVVQNKNIRSDTVNLHAFHEKEIVARTSVFAAIFLTCMKLVIGLLTGSLGILSEALHSGLDLIAAGVTYIAVRSSGKPADQEHTYGHGKIENVSALFETMLLLVTCVWIIYEAIQRLFFKSVEVDVSIWSFIVMSSSIVIDINRSRMLRRVAERHNSQALEADALHFSTDIWSSAVVIIGLFLVLLSEKLNLLWMVKADALAALGVSGIVVYVSLQLGRRAIAQLTDEISPGIILKISELANDVPLVVNVLEVRARHSGPQTYADVTIALQKGISLEEAHEVAERVEAAIRDFIPMSSVMVHIDPVSQDTSQIISAPKLDP